MESATNLEFTTRQVILLCIFSASASLATRPFFAGQNPNIYISKMQELGKFLEPNQVFWEWNSEGFKRLYFRGDPT